MQRDFALVCGGGVCALVFGVQPNLPKVSAVCVGASQAPAILQSHQTRNTSGKNTKVLWIIGMLLSKKPQSLCALFV